jgi:hypothetical protein
VLVVYMLSRSATPAPSITFWWKKMYKRRPLFMTV